MAGPILTSPTGLLLCPPRRSLVVVPSGGSEAPSSGWVPLLAMALCRFDTSLFTDHGHSSPLDSPSYLCISRMQLSLGPRGGRLSRTTHLKFTAELAQPEDCGDSRSRYCFRRRHSSYRIYRCPKVSSCLTLHFLGAGGGDGADGAMNLRQTQPAFANAAWALLSRYLPQEPSAL